MTFYLLSAISPDILSGVLSGISSDSRGEHCHPELAAGNIAIRSWRLRSGGEHCHPKFAVEEAVGQGDEEEEVEEARQPT